jgi:hypothetical protein
MYVFVYVLQRYNQSAQDLSGGNNNKACQYDACMCQDVQTRSQRGCQAPMSSGCNSVTMALGANDYVCFGTRPLRNQDNQVEEDYRTAIEPADPIWYSTVLAVVPPGGFLNIPPDVYTPPSWNQRESCIDCAFQSSLLKVNITQSPDWTVSLATTCMDCSMKNSMASIAALPLSGSNQPMAGAPNANTFTWVTGTAGVCTCAGTATRSVTCTSGTGGTVTDSNCAGTKPSTIVACTDVPASCYVWNIGIWTNCSVDCSTGIQTATVKCVQSSSSPQPGATVSNSLCPQPAPASQRVCTGKLGASCPTKWKVSGFGSCTVRSVNIHSVQLTYPFVPSFQSNSSPFLRVPAYCLYLSLCTVAVVELRSVALGLCNQSCVLTHEYLSTHIHLSFHLSYS